MKTSDQVLAHLARKHDHRMAVHYAKDQQSELARLCDLYGADKGHLEAADRPAFLPAHTYSDFYELIFGQKRACIRLVLECGIGSNNPALPSSMRGFGTPGASLRVWRDYFPNAHVIGIDIDGEVLFSEDRIQTYLVDQTSPDSIRKFLDATADDGPFDIVVDDGLHVFDAGRTLFEVVVHRLSKDGVYVIEDVGISDLMRYSDYFAGLIDQYYVRFVNLYRPGRSLGDNSLIMVTHKAGAP